METSIHQRVKQARLHLKISQDEVAEAIEKTVSAVSKIESGSQGVTPELITFYFRKGINTEWILMGIGEMLKSKEVKEFVNRTDARVEEQEIPLYEHKASAGLTKLFSNSENILDYIRVPNLPKCDGAVHISGDSMYPLLKSGDIVMYKQIHDIMNGIFWGEMYLVSLNLDDEDYTLVKYIQKSEIGEDYVKLVSQNQYHAPKDVPIKSIRALGYIKASIRINSMA